MKRIFKLYSNGRKNKTFLTQSIILVKLNMYNDYTSNMSRGPIITMRSQMEKTGKIVISANMIYMHIYTYIHSYTLEIFCPIKLICCNTNKINIKETLVPTYSSMKTRHNI